MGFLLSQIIQIYIFIVILSVLMSWVVMAVPRTGAVYSVKRVLDGLVDPALNPIRKAIRPFTGDMPLDLSPIALILLLNLLQSFAIRILR